MATNAGQLTDAATKSGALASVKNTVPPAPAVLDKTAPGEYTMCGVGIRGDMQDPSFQRKMAERTNEIPVRCQRITLSSDKEATLAVPAATFEDKAEQ